MRSNNNNPLTRDEILSRYFPQYRPAVAASQGLSGGSCIIAHDTTVSCCAVITTPTLHQPIFTSLPRLIPIASQSCAASAFYTPLDGGRISAWCGKFRSARCRRTGGLTVSFASTAAFWLAYCAIATIGAVLVVLRSGKAYAVLVAAAQTVAKTVNLARFGSRLCIWMSMATI